MPQMHKVQFPAQRGEHREDFPKRVPLPILCFEVVFPGWFHITVKEMITLVICVAISPKPKTKPSWKDIL